MAPKSRLSNPRETYRAEVSVPFSKLLTRELPREVHLIRAILPFLAAFLTIGPAIAQDAATAGNNTPSPSNQAQVDKIFAKWDSPSSPGCAPSVMKDGHG